MKKKDGVSEKLVKPKTDKQKALEAKREKRWNEMFEFYKLMKAKGEVN